MRKKKWTVMVYLAGDNNLSENMISSLIGMQDAMKTKGSDEFVNLIAIYDSGYPTVRIQTYHFTHKNSALPLTAIGVDIINRNGGSSETAHITDFVNFVVHEKGFEAENYALIMSGHSDGILGKTMFRDNNPDSEMNLNYLKYILRLARKSLKGNEKFTNRNGKFALIGFDSCMMGMLEVGYELRNVAEFMVASQGYAPIDGWDYEKVLRELIEKKGRLTPEEFAKSIVKSHIDFSCNYKAGGRAMNLNCVDLDKAANLRKSINNLAKLFNGILDEPTSKVSPDIAERNAVFKEITKRLIHDSHYQSQTYLHEQAVDILDFVKNLSANCDLKQNEMEILAGSRRNGKNGAAGLFEKKLGLIKAACSKVETALKKYVKLNRAFGAEYQFSEGVSIFFPWTLLAYFMVYQKYNGLDFSRKSDWRNFIEKFAEQTLRANSQPRLNETPDFLTWVGSVESAQKAETARAETARAETARAETAKGAEDGFYRLFRRFRNHPIYHDVDK